MLFRVTRLVLTCYSSHRKLIHSWREIGDQLLGVGFLVMPSRKQTRHRARKQEARQSKYDTMPERGPPLTE